MGRKIGALTVATQLRGVEAMAEPKPLRLYTPGVRPGLVRNCALGRDDDGEQ